MGKTRSFVSALSGPTNLFLITGCARGLRHYWDIVFPFTRIAVCVWSNTDTREHGRKLGNVAVNKTKENIQSSLETIIAHYQKNKQKKTFLTKCCMVNTVINNLFLAFKAF